MTKTKKSVCIEESVQKILLFVDSFGQINVAMRDSATGSPLTLSYGHVMLIELVIHLS